MSINPRKFCILLALLTAAILLAGIANAIGGYINKQIGVLLFNKQYGTTYDVAVIIGGTLAHSRVIINIVMALFIYFTFSKRVKISVWFGIALLFGIKGLLFFLLFLAHKTFSDNQSTYNLKLLGTLLWVAIPLNVAIFFYGLDSFLSIPGSSHTVRDALGNIPPVSQLSFIVNNIAIAIWILFTPKFSEDINKILLCLFALVAGVFCPILFFLKDIYNYLLAADSEPHPGPLKPEDTISV